jgi:hypothetical protein
MFPPHINITNILYISPNNLYLYICVCIYICVYICVCVYIYIYFFIAALIMSVLVIFFLEA